MPGLRRPYHKGHLAGLALARLPGLIGKGRARRARHPYKEGMDWISYRRPGMGELTRVRLTRRRQRVLLVLLSGAGNLHDERLRRAARVRPGTLYPFLSHLEAAGWVVRHRRSIGLERKYCYDLTDAGRAHAAAGLCLILPAGVPLS